MLQALDQVIPYIELPDMMLAQPQWLNANILTAFNLSARHGVVGTPLPVPADEAGRAAMLQALGGMKLRASDGNGKTLGESTGSELLGHPLNAALWLVQALTQEGIRLQPGQYLSLGSFPPVMLPRPGLKFVVDYQGLPGAEPVWVQFTQWPLQGRLASLTDSPKLECDPKMDP